MTEEIENGDSNGEIERKNGTENRVCDLVKERKERGKLVAWWRGWRKVGIADLREEKLSSIHTIHIQVYICIGELG